MDWKEFKEQDQEIQKKQLTELIESGLSLEKIWEQFSCTKGTIVDTKEKLEINTPAVQEAHTENLIIQRLESIEAQLQKLSGDTVAIADELMLIPRKFNGKVTQISYRFHDEVIEKLTELCEKYPYYTKQYIINSLLIEAIEKYL